MSVLIARAYKRCDRCNAGVQSRDEILDCGHGRGVCVLCLRHLQLRRSLRILAHYYPKCFDCKKRAPRKYFPELVSRDCYPDSGLIGLPLCQTCELRREHHAQAVAAERYLRQLAIKRLTWGTKGVLKEGNLPEELIQTQIAQLKLQNLWQSPKISPTYVSNSSKPSIGSGATLAEQIR